MKAELMFDNIGGGSPDISDIIGQEYFQYCRGVSEDPQASALYVVGINEISFRVPSGGTVYIWENSNKTGAIDTIAGTTKTVDVSSYNVIFLSSYATVQQCFYTVLS